MTDRPTWDDHWMEHAVVAGRRAACTRAQVGAVVVRTEADGTQWMVSEGYNGAPAGAVECTDGGCPRGLQSTAAVAPGSDYSIGDGRCVAAHAEANAIIRAGVSARGATLVVTREPCHGCGILIRAAGITRVVGPGGVSAGSWVAGQLNQLRGPAAAVQTATPVTPVTIYPWREPIDPRYTSHPNCTACANHNHGACTRSAIGGGYCSCAVFNHRVTSLAEGTP